MIEDMAEEESIPVPKIINKSLTHLAGNLSGDITALKNPLSNLLFRSRSNKSLKI
jgi:hypothetical protein